MLLAIDIGNSNIVLGVFSGDTLEARWRLATDQRATPDQYGVLLDSLFRTTGVDARRLDGAIVCSVVPPVKSALNEAIKQYWDITAIQLGEREMLGLDIQYEPTTSVGEDRIANAVATIERYGCPAVVVDFGTATTFDAISRDAVYVGGAISPGLEISEEALITHTAQLPRVALEPPATVIGTNTVESLQSGILLGYAGLVDGLVERFRRELGSDAHIVATGGLAAVVAPYTQTVQRVDPDLTLIGLQILYQRLQQPNAHPRARQDQPVA